MTTLAFGDVTVALGDGFVATVEIHRAPNNYFDLALLRSLADAYVELEGRDDCRAIVLCSEGKHFCAGVDFAAGFAPDGAASTAVLYVEAARLFHSQLPVVAAIQGAAVGGGLGLACSADFRVVAPEARFAANFARLGFHQGFGLSVTLPRIVGPQRAAELLYTGRRINADEAMALGLCDRGADAAELRMSAIAFAAELASSAPLAVRSIRATLRADLLSQLDEALQREAIEQDRLRATADWREGIRAMAERREPRFEGR